MMALKGGQGSARESFSFVLGPGNLTHMGQLVV